VLREHEIVFLGISGAPVERQITIDDLMVSVVGERIILTSRRLGREVIPRLTTAHNFRLRSLGIYRFLCALQNSSGPGWSWGVLGGAPFLPRVCIGNVVLSRATWQVSGNDLEPITKIVREMANKKAQTVPLAERRARIANAVGQLRAALRLPRFVVIVDADNELPIDLDNPLLVQVFADELSGRQGAQLVELFPAPDASPVRGPEGCFANQIVLGFVRPVTPRAPTTPEVTPAPAVRPRIARSFSPGSSWLYAKLYAGTSTVDRVLREAIAPLVRGALERGDASHWFFIRYGDPHHHVRLRLCGDPARLSERVLPALHSAIEPLRADRSIWKVQLDTYEREIERYGGDRGIELCEQLFWIDSEAVLSILELLEGDAGADARWRLALRGSETLLDVLGFDADMRHRIFADARDSLGREHGVGADFYAPIGDRYKRERAALEALFVPDTARDAEHDLSPGLELLARRDDRLRVIADELRRRDQLHELVPNLRAIAWSLVHMHVNRVLHASHRAQELVLYDLLRRLHEARRARGKKS
jgi:lantibiotic biosynthesis protein